VRREKERTVSSFLPCRWRVYVSGVGLTAIRDTKVATTPSYSCCDILIAADACMDGVRIIGEYTHRCRCMYGWS